MELSKLAIFVLVSLQLLAKFCIGKSREFALKRSGMRMKDVLKWDETNLPTLLACTAWCSQENDCLTISYNHGGKRCLRSKKQAIHQKPDEKFVVLPGWTSISVRQFSVYNRRGPSGHYTVTWSNAASVCEAENTSMASEADLLESRAMGLYVCECGWLTNGRNGFVMQERIPNCFPHFNEEVLYCANTKANVWCLF